MISDFYSVLYKLMFAFPNLWEKLPYLICEILLQTVYITYSRACGFPDENNCVVRLSCILSYAL